MSIQLHHRQKIRRTILPVEILLIIFSNLTKNLGILRMVCRDFRDLIDAEYGGEGKKTYNIEMARSISLIQFALQLQPYNGVIYPVDEYICSRAASFGNLELIIWARDPLTVKPRGITQIPWDQETCYQAARKGHLHVLAGIRNPDLAGGPCPWSSLLCEYAAQYGHLHILEWVRSEDRDQEAGRCPLDQETYKWAVLEGHNHIINRLIDF